jgi:hypothetical protein
MSPWIPIFDALEELRALARHHESRAKIEAEPGPTTQAASRHHQRRGLRVHQGAMLRNREAIESSHHDQTLAACPDS